MMPYFELCGQVLFADSSADSNGLNQHDPLITDVHTAPPDQVDGQGGVLHVATGNMDFLLIAVDNAPDRMIYAGPVMSHYEFCGSRPEADPPVRGRVAGGIRLVADIDWPQKSTS